MSDITRGFLFLTIAAAITGSEPSVSADDQQSAAVAEARAAGLQNFMILSERISSGSEPSDEATFEYLRKFGAKTVVSVDGGIPPVQLAHRFGLRYVHIPIGYDGVPESAIRSLVAVLRQTQGRIYVHCHHGKHRGPAAAALACRIEGTVDQRSALDILEQAGTSRDYAGLWRDVADFRMPVDNVPLPDLTEVAEVESMVAAMARLSRHFENLQHSNAADVPQTDSAVNVKMIQEAVLLKEILHEARRHSATEYDQQFRLWLQESEEQAAQLVQALKAGQQPKVSSSLESLKRGCVHCHQAYRN